MMHSPAYWGLCFLGARASCCHYSHQHDRRDHSHHRDSHQHDRRDHSHHRDQDRDYRHDRYSDSR